jgi:membrane-bound metal-dependent hydrolase YbcI (DUF457 family)
LGVIGFGWIAQKILRWTAGWVLVDNTIVWWAFLLGVISHLVADSLTKEGVPLLWPLPIKFGIPPIKALRITTGEWMEKVVFVGLLIGNAWWFREYQGLFLDLAKGF